MVENLNLGQEDPTIFASCRICNKGGKGVKIGDISCKAYTERRWKRQPVCENCDGPMTKIFEIEKDD